MYSRFCKPRRMASLPRRGVPSVTLHLEVIVRSGEIPLALAQLVMDEPAEVFLVFRSRLENTRESYGFFIKLYSVSIDWLTD